MLFLGYYTRMEFYWVVIKPKFVDVIKDAILGKDRKTREFQYMLEGLEVGVDRWLDWNWEVSPDIGGKWRQDEELADWLRPYCEGGFLVFWSLEDDKGSGWAFEFDGKGGVSACSARRPAALEGWMKRRSRDRERDVGKGS